MLTRSIDMCSLLAVWTVELGLKGVYQTVVGESCPSRKNLRLTRQFLLDMSQCKSGMNIEVVARRTSNALKPPTFGFI